MHADDQWKEWLGKRPEAVRKMAARFPPGTKFNIHGEVMEVMSYEEDGGLSITRINPRVDYERAVAERQRVCPCCIARLDDLIVK